MVTLYTLYQRIELVMAIVIIVALWDLIFKAIALYKSAQRKQVAWFVCVLIFNTAGILPIIYLLIYRGKEQAKKEDTVKEEKAPAKKKAEEEEEEIPNE